MNRSSSDLREGSLRVLLLVFGTTLRVLRLLIKPSFLGGDLEMLLVFGLDFGLDVAVPTSDLGLLGSLNLLIVLFLNLRNTTLGIELMN